jgi:chromosomal replication initiator protein
VLEDQVNKPSFESWIKTAHPVRMQGNVAVIGTCSQFAKHWLETKHAEAIREILEDHLGFEVKLRVEIIEREEPPMMSEKLPKTPKPQTKLDDDSVFQPLNDKYSFDNFVVGPTNRLAHACAAAVAEEPGRTYNPLFIYGGAGLGKTHLMHAVGLMAMCARPDMRVVYVSGEQFTYHYITSLREHRTAEFRRRYRNVDLWLVDDIQFLAGKERTEEEFFHTYNAIYETGKQIVLTSDRPPKDLELDGRLRSRFECGMLADISPPDLETRMAILQTKAETECMSLTNDVILYIARLITCNIRQLEGALIKLHAYASLMKTEVTPSLAEEVLGRYFVDNAPPVVDVRKIVEEVAKRFGVEPSEIKGKCRSKDIVAPRQLAMYLTRILTDTSLPAIGKAFGGKDHSTVLHACRRVEAKLGNDRAFAGQIEEISRHLKTGHSE